MNKSLGYYLQSLQDLIDDLFRVKPATSAPIIISISIFLIGFFLSGIVKSFGRSHIRRITRRIFFQSLENLVKQIDLQGQAYNKMSSDIAFRTSEEGGQYMLKKTNLYQAMVLNKIGYESIFKAFFTGFSNTVLKSLSNKKRIKAFNKIWGCIENAKS